MKSGILIATALLLSLVACNGRNKQVPDFSLTSGLQRDLPIDILGTQRLYHLFLPDNPSSAQIVFLLHGNRGSSDQILGLTRTKAPFKVWIDIALRENLILAVPNGAVGAEGHQGWNDCRSDALGNPDTDDVLFINTLIDFLIAQYRVTETNVFVVGISNGGMMAMRLAEEIPEKLNAFASVVASRPLNTVCTTSTVPVSALIMNGTADPILPNEGGHIRPARGELYSTMDTVAYWVNRNQTNTAMGSVTLPDVERNDNSTVKVYDYLEGRNNTRVRHYEVVGGGHTEPSITEKYSGIYKLVVGEQNNDIEMAEEIWSYFDSL